MQLVFADRYVKAPRGLIKDVNIGCGTFTILADFVVMDTREEDVTLLLGRPFMATAGMTINVPNGSLTLRVGQNSVTFRLKDGMIYIPKGEAHCLSVDTVELASVNSVTNVIPSVAPKIDVTGAEQVINRKNEPPTQTPRKKEEPKASPAKSPRAKDPDEVKKESKMKTKVVWKPTTPPSPDKPPNESKDIKDLYRSFKVTGILPDG
ncbi:hypothetical protein LINPERPRIM_LOCUS11081 [Linum perenne]